MAQGEPPPLGSYGALPAFKEVTLSPEGRLSMRETSGGKRSMPVPVFPLKPVNMVEVGVLKVRQIAWVVDDAVMVLSTQTIDLDERFLARNTEISHVMIVPAEGDGPVRTIFADDRTMVHAVFG